MTDWNFSRTDEWEYSGNAWENKDNGFLSPVSGGSSDDSSCIQGYNFVFHNKLAYNDFEAVFDFIQKPHSDVGIVFGAKNASSFYMLHFPCCGQAYRAQHFWVALSEMREDGYLRIIERRMVNRINSYINTVHSVSIKYKDETLRLTIDGRASLDLTGIRDGAGAAGLCLFNGAEIIDFRINGAENENMPWIHNIRQSANWFHPCLSTEHGHWQRPINLLRPSAGELLLYFGMSEGYSGKPVYCFIRSYDNGMTWTAPEEWWRKEGIWEGESRSIHVFPDNVMRCMIFRNGFRDIIMIESKDGGRSWSDAKPVFTGKIPGSMSDLYLGPQGFVNLSDGTTVMFAYGSIQTKIPDTEIYTWGSLHCQAFSARSTDGGYTWTDFINIDGTKDPVNGNAINGNMDFTEVCGVQTNCGDIAALIRPVYSPWMWEARSTDGGATWLPAVRGPFPGYAAPNMTRTASGFIIIAHRLPGLTVDVSADDGQTWTHSTMIDSAIWAMGSMLEVEPDIILYIYWDSFESLMRGQFFKVTGSGLIPVRY